MKIFLIFIMCTATMVFSNNDNLTTVFLNYCSHPDCSLKNQHTMCAAIDKQSPRLYASGMTTWMRYQILLLHNRYRDNIAMGLEAGQPSATNMRKMYWDYELEEIAEVWARQCQKRHDECRNTLRFNVLQNMDVRPVVARVTEAQLLADAVGAWFSGSRVLAAESVWSFRLNNCSSPGGCNSHWYSTAAWSSTWRLGCSQALCTSKQRTCSERKLKTSTNLSKNESIDNHKNRTEAGPPDLTTENILRRTQYDKLTTDFPSLKEFSRKAKEQKDSKSPLYRGVLEAKINNDPKIVAYTFCNYGPSGNIDGFPIYEAGTPCSNCPQGTKCGDRTHRALCAVLGDPDLKH